MGLSSCNAGGSNPTPEIIPSVSPVPTSTSAPQSSETQSPVTLTIWLPPQQSPYAENPAAELLSERLAEYEESHPSFKIQIRLKEEEGTAGLFQSLLTTHNAAPSALPDIVGLSPKAIRQSVSADLLNPLETLFESSETSDWYDHTEPASVLNGDLFGIPYASDTDIFIYKMSSYSETPISWSDLISGDETFLIPAGDRSARFTLAQYLDLGGVLEPSDSNQIFDVGFMREILEFYYAARESGHLPLSALQLVSAEEVFTALSEDGADGAVVPLEAYLHQISKSQYAANPLPTQDGDGFIFTKTYSWAIVNGNFERQLASAELVRWLVEPDFLGPWAYELGMLPASSSALAQWPDSATAALANRLIRAATPLPDYDILDQLGPLVQTAIEEVLFGRMSPQQAAETLQEPVTTP